MTADVLIEALTCTIKTRGDGAVVYRNVAGDYHRTGGPAIVYPDGTVLWHRNGLLHRTDGPAILYPSGTEEWYQNGLRHRLNGPAVVLPNGREFWYIKGQKYTRKQYANKISTLFSDQQPTT